MPIRRRAALLCTAAFVLSAVASTRSQTLKLGDPRPPDRAALSAGRAKVDQLREQAEALRGEANQGNQTSQAVKLAQARWRDMAAWLIEQPEPLTQARITLLGWRLAENDAALDRAISDAATDQSLSAVQRDDVRWNLKRFTASPLPGAAVENSAAEPDAALAQIRVAIRPLVEALSVHLGAGVSDAPWLARVARDRAMMADDTDLAPLLALLDRCDALAQHAGWRVEALDAERVALEFVEHVRQLDEAGWLGTAWTSHRSAAIGAEIQLSPEPGVGGHNRVAQRVGAMARCVEQFTQLMALPPSVRPRLDSYREVLAEWIDAALSTDQPRPWDLLSDAFDAMAARRANQFVPAHRELRMVCAALDDQSNELERMMARWLGGDTVGNGRSDPDWVSVIGQHRENTRDKQILLELPAAIDLLGQHDPRASAIVWKRMLPDARAVADPIVRQTLLAAARAITAFKTQHTGLPLEDDWRSGAEWLEPLIGSQRVSVLARLDALRTIRAAELTSGQALAATEAELDAMRDLFRLVATWRDLQDDGRLRSPSSDADGVVYPDGLAAQERRRLEAALRRAVEQAARGGPLFVRAAEEARQDAAGAVVIASLADGDRQTETEPPTALTPLLAMARTCAWDSASEDVSRHRLAQWCVLQFEAAQGNRAVEAYLQFLSVRLAEARWARSD